MCQLTCWPGTAHILVRSSPKSIRSSHPVALPRPPPHPEPPFHAAPNSPNGTPGFHSSAAQCANLNPHPPPFTIPPDPSCSRCKLSASTAAMMTPCRPQQLLACLVAFLACARMARAAPPGGSGIHCQAPGVLITGSPPLNNPTCAVAGFAGTDCKVGLTDYWLFLCLLAPPPLLLLLLLVQLLFSFSFHLLLLPRAPLTSCRICHAATAHQQHCHPLGLPALCNLCNTLACQHAQLVHVALNICTYSAQKGPPFCLCPTYRQHTARP